MSDIEETFVYEGIEVKKTGRVAKRTTSRKTIVIIEIKPANSDSTSMNQWVKEDELYMIKE